MRKLLIAFAVALFLGLIGLGLFGDRGLISYHKLRRDRVKLEQDADQLRKENQSLRQKIELLGSDLKYLEKLARQKLGMVRPDEVIIKVPESGAGEPAAKDDLSKEKDK